MGQAGSGLGGLRSQNQANKKPIQREKRKMKMKARKLFRSSFPIFLLPFFLVILSSSVRFLDFAIRLVRVDRIWEVGSNPNSPGDSLSRLLARDTSRSGFPDQHLRMTPEALGTDSPRGFGNRLTVVTRRRAAAKGGRFETARDSRAARGVRRHRTFRFRCGWGCDPGGRAGVNDAPPRSAGPSQKIPGCRRKAI